MPALLDFLTTPEAQLGLNLLAAGGPTTDPNRTSFGARVAGATQATQAMQDAEEDRKLKRIYLKGQIDGQKLAQQKYLDSRNDANQYFALLSGGAPGVSAAPPALLQGQGTAPAAGGTASPAAPAADSVPPQVQQAVARGQPLDISKLQPDQILALQYLAKKAGAPDPVEVWKASRPDMQVSNGYAYDKNSLKSGYLPQLNISQSGQASLVQIGPDGLPVVSAPRGAVDTYETYQGVQDRSRASNTPGRPVILPGGRMGGQSQLDEIRGGPAPAATPSGPLIGPRGMRNGRETSTATPGATDAGTTPQDFDRIIAQYRTDLRNVTDPQARASIEAEIADLQRQRATYSAQSTATPAGYTGGAVIGRGGAAPAPAVPGGGLEFSPAEKAQQASGQEFATTTAKADADQLKTWRDGATAGQQAIQTAQNLRRIASSGIYEGGGAQAKTAVASLINGLTGYTPKELPGSEQFNAEASNLVLGQIKALGANPSNADRDFIMRTIPQIDRSPQAREALINFMENKGRSAIDLYNRADTYARKNNGLGGFDQFAAPTTPARATPAPTAIPAGWTVKVK